MFLKPATLPLVLVALVLQAQPYRSATVCHRCADGPVSEADRDEVDHAYEAALTNAWSSRVRAGFGLLRRIDTGMLRQFEKAWEISSAGHNGREGVVLISLALDDSYRGKSLGFTGEYHKFSFAWDASTVAIVHTHPNNADPKPSGQDERVAQKYDVPIFTITLRGMYVYDPDTRITLRVLHGLDWLKPSKWTPDVYRDLIANFLSGGKHRPPSATTIGATR